MTTQLSARTESSRTRPEALESAQQSADSVIPNPLLIALPTVIALGNIHTSAAAGAVVLIGMVALVTAHQTTDRIRLTVASLVLPVAGLTVALRPYQASTVGPMFYLFVSVSLALVVGISRSRRSATISLIDGLGVLLIAAIVLRLAGIGTPSDHAPAVMGNLLTGGERVLFPLAGGLAGAPALAAAYLVATVLIIRRIPNHRTYRICGALAASYVLVAGDRRSALFAVIVLLLVIAWTPKRFRQVAPWTIGALLALPLWLHLTGLLTARFVTTSAPLLKRTGERDMQGLNDRLEIWSRALEFYQNRVDWFHQAFGFGTSGQVVSGASMTYRNLFSGQGDQNSKSIHNSVVQAMFDGGWITATGLLVSVVCLAWVLSRSNSTGDLAALAMLTTVAIVGSTESLLSPGSTQPPWWILVALGMIGFSQDEKIVQKSSAAQSIGHNSHDQTSIDTPPYSRHRGSVRRIG